MARPPQVAPLVGAWIEMFMDIPEGDGEFVAPLVGAWIEISEEDWWSDDCVSLLSWARGLKYERRSQKRRKIMSLLSWERGLKSGTILPEDISPRRSSRGSVD